jgi:hypothetical protein
MAVRYELGSQGDIPLAIDVDADGLTEPAVFRPSTAEWFIRYSPTAHGDDDSRRQG